MKKLLLAVDFHHAADEVIAQAIPWAKALGARIDLIFVDESWHNAMLVSDPAVQTLLVDQWDAHEHRNNAHLSALAATLPADVRGTHRYVAGLAVQEIVAAAEDYDALLIGTHGRKGLRRLVLGSVAERVIRRATCPVVVLRPTALPGPAPTAP